jgi:hypothetical protein
MSSDELKPRTPAERKAYLEGVMDGKIYAVRDGLATPPAAAQPAQQEPYGWVQPNPSFNSGIFNLGSACPSGWVGSAIDVYTTPPEAAPVQQEPVAWRLNGESSLGHGKVFGKWKSGKPPKDVADLASVDKNWSLEFAYTTPPAAQQEPTEYLYRVDVSRMKEGECTKYDHPIYFYSKADANNYCWTINQAPQQRTIVVAESHAIKIATPPAAQRQWVELTDAELADMHATLMVKLRGCYETKDLYRAIEARLKERNT